MKTKQSLFLEALVKLCEEYNANIYYTIDDNGIHIEVDGKECFVGFGYDANYFSMRLREQAKKC